MWKRILFICLAILFTLTTVVLIAVAYQQEPQVLVVTDDSNQRIQYFRLPQRVVVLEPAVANLVRHWQRENWVVATSEDLQSLFPEAENLGPAEYITVLNLAATSPDLVIGGPEQKALIEELRSYGYAAIMVRLERLNSLMTWPEKLGSLLAAKQQAAQTLRLLEKQLGRLATKVETSSVAGRRILWLVDDQLTVAGRNTLQDDLLQLLQVKNAGAVFNKYKSIVPEDIRVLNPEIIITPRFLLPEIEKQFGGQLEQAPLFLAWDEPLHRVGWHTVLSDAEDLFMHLEALLDMAEEAGFSAGN